MLKNVLGLNWPQILRLVYLNNNYLNQLFCFQPPSHKWPKWAEGFPATLPFTRWVGLSELPQPPAVQPNTTLLDPPTAPTTPLVAVPPTSVTLQLLPKTRELPKEAPAHTMHRWGIPKQNHKIQKNRSSTISCLTHRFLKTQSKFKIHT